MPRELLNRGCPLIRTVSATRYVTPLRGGNSLPAIVEGADDRLYVVKFRETCRGHRALIAELVAGEIGRALGLPVPEIVFVDVDPLLARSEEDSEVKRLIVASAGTNIGLAYLPGAIAFDIAASRGVDPVLAARIVWFDAFTSNNDRTAKNTNLMVWHRKLVLIDHGAALYFHHTRGDYRARAVSPFPQIRDHVLLRIASDLRMVDAELAARLSPATLTSIVDLIPDSWLGDVEEIGDVAAHRAAYLTYLRNRVDGRNAFLEEVYRAKRVRFWRFWHR